MKRMQIFMKRIVFNGKLNREKFINNRERFINNKKKVIMSKANMMVKRQIHTNFMNGPNGPPENNWLLIAFCVTIGYSILIDR